MDKLLADQEYVVRAKVQIWSKRSPNHGNISGKTNMGFTTVPLTILADRKKQKYPG